MTQSNRAYTVRRHPSFPEIEQTVGWINDYLAIVARGDENGGDQSAVLELEQVVGGIGDNGHTAPE